MSPGPWGVTRAGMEPLASRLGVFYHYTSREGLLGILASGVILPSLPHQHTPLPPGGRGDLPTVFLTRMDPSNPREVIAYNNYQNGWSRKMWKVEACIILEMPDRILSRREHGRSIVMWQGGPICLTDCNVVSRAWYMSLTPETPLNGPIQPVCVHPTPFQTHPMLPSPQNFPQYQWTPHQTEHFPL